MWLFGCIPLLSADFAVAVSLAQVPGAEQHLSRRSNDTLICPSEVLRGYLVPGDSVDWQELAVFLAGCIPEPSALAMSQNLDQSDAAIRQVVALYRLQELANQDGGSDVLLASGAIDWLTNKFKLSSDKSSLDSPMSRAVAATTLSAMAVSVVSAFKPSHPDTDIAKQDQAALTALLNGQSGKAFDLSAVVETLSSLATSPESRIQLAAAAALRDLGYVLQAQTDSLRFEGMKQPGSVPDSIRSWQSPRSNRQSSSQPLNSAQIEPSTSAPENEPHWASQVIAAMAEQLTHDITELACLKDE